MGLNLKIHLNFSRVAFIRLPDVQGPDIKKEYINLGNEPFVAGQSSPAEFSFSHLGGIF